MSALHERVCSALSGCGSAFTNEDEMQQAIAELLVAGGLIVQREHYMGPGAGRIDLLVRQDLAGGGLLGIECKVAGPCDDLLRQLRRYARSGLLDRLVVATTRPVHGELRGEVIDGVSVDVIVLRGGIC